MTQQHGGNGRISKGIDGTEQTFQPTFFSSLAKFFKTMKLNVSLTTLSQATGLKNLASPFKSDATLPGFGLNTKGQAK
jgi:hypothetical protein